MDAGNVNSIVGGSPALQGGKVGQYLRGVVRAANLADTQDRQDYCQHWGDGQVLANTDKRGHRRDCTLMLRPATI